MSKLTNLTVKGQVTIPKDVRDALGLRPNQPVEIDWQGGDEAVIRRPRLDAATREAAIQVELTRLDAVLSEYAHLRTGVPVDEQMAELRDPVATPPAGR